MTGAGSKRIMFGSKWILLLHVGMFIRVESSPEDFRLPGNVVPDHYRIKILTDLSENFFYNGEVYIDFLVKSATNKVVLHSKHLKIFENETKLEEYGKFVPYDSGKIVRRPKVAVWDEVEFRDRPTAELDEPFDGNLKENERVLASERKKPDVVFDRHEVFEKQKDEFLRSAYGIEETGPQIFPKPQPSNSVVLHQKIKETNMKDKQPVTQTTVTPKSERPTERTRFVTIPTVEYTGYPSTTTPSQVTNQEDRLTSEGTTTGYTNDHHPSSTQSPKDSFEYSTTDKSNNEMAHTSTFSVNTDIKHPQESTTLRTTTDDKIYFATTKGTVFPQHVTTPKGTEGTQYVTTPKGTEGTQYVTTPKGTERPQYVSTPKTTVIPSHATTEWPYHLTPSTPKGQGWPKYPSTPNITAWQQHGTTPKYVISPLYPTPPKTFSLPQREVTPDMEHPTTQPTVTQFSHPQKDHVVTGYSVLKHEFDVENNFLVLHFDKELTSGRKYRLYLTYQGVLTDTLTGFYRVPYVKRGTTKSTWLASTVFEPNEARSAFPCFDEPALKATFDVTLGHDKKFTALSNMPLKSKSPIAGKPDWQWSEFETTPRMSTYVVAFLISDLEYLTPRLNYTESGPNVTYRFWARPDVLYKTRYAMRIAPEMKNYLENLLEVRDVLPKHDFVALPSFISSALENWGLYSFAEKNMLFSPGFSSILTKFEITQVLGHEIAHMWFGNMVTPKWWDQIWLSEGFSNFFEILAADHVQPTWDLKSISVIFSYLKVFTYDALHSSHSLVPKLNHPSSLNEIFDSITYQKGFFLVRMLNYTLGQDTFLNGVRKYLKSNLLSVVDENDLWEVLTESAHQENALPAEHHLKDIMHSWTRRPGYPIVEVIRDYENNTANVTQRRFLRSKDDYEFRDNSPDLDGEETKWWIPLTYTTGSELNFRDFKPRVWLDPQEDYKILADMPSRSDFVLMNLDAAGLYRVNYDQRNWALIISYLVNENSSDISVINRVQILDDLLDLARSGEISYETALDATSYLYKEKHFLPWKAALSNFDFISRMLRSTDSSKSLKKFIRNLVAPTFEELGFESTRNEPLSVSLNRKQMVKWACKTGLRQCTRKSISLFKKWMEEKKPDEHNPIPSNLRSIAYCTAIENGGSKDWQFLWQRYLSNVVTDKTAILTGLGCSRSTRTLKKYLDWSIKESSGIKKQDTPVVFKAVVRNDIGFSLAKNFLRERMGDIKSYLGSNPFYLPQMIETIAAKMNQPKDLVELEELEEEHFSHLRSAPRSFRQAAERVRFNINWVERNEKLIGDWLKKKRI